MERLHSRSDFPGLMMPGQAISDLDRAGIETCPICYLITYLTYTQSRKRPVN